MRIPTVFFIVFPPERSSSDYRQSVFLDNFGSGRYHDLMHFALPAIIIEITKDLSWRD